MGCDTAKHSHIPRRRKRRFCMSRSPLSTCRPVDRTTTTVVVAIVDVCVEVAQGVRHLDQPLAQIELILGNMAVAVDGFDAVAFAIVEGLVGVAGCVRLYN